MSDATMTPKAEADAIYIGDGGRTYCGEHLGCQARHTLRDLSGQSVHRVTPADVEYCWEEGLSVPSCETCGKSA